MIICIILFLSVCRGFQYRNEQFTWGFSRCWSIEIVWDTYFSNSLKLHTQEIGGCQNLFNLQKQTVYQNIQCAVYDKNKVALNSFLICRLLTLDFGCLTVFTFFNRKIKHNFTNVSKEDTNSHKRTLIQKVFFKWNISFSVVSKMLLFRQSMSIF